MPDFEPQSVRLKDIGKIQTVQDVQLIGYGLITGLEGNGDGRGAPFTVQSLANLMRNMGVEVDPGTIRAKGLVNTREHVERLFEAERMGVASLQQYLMSERDASDESNFEKGAAE